MNVQPTTRKQVMLVTIDALEFRKEALSKEVDECHNQLKGERVDTLENGLFAKRWRDKLAKAEHTLSQVNNTLAELKSMAGEPNGDTTNDS